MEKDMFVELTGENTENDSENRCGEAHNNCGEGEGEENCLECQIIIRNI